MSHKYGLELKNLGSSDEQNDAESFSKNIISKWENSKTKRSILTLLVSANKATLFIIIVLSIILAVLSAACFILIQLIISSFNKNVEHEYPLHWLITIYLIGYVVCQFINRHLIMYQNLFANKSTVELITLIYNKIQTVSPSGPKNKAKESEIINFVQVDADKIITIFTNAPTFLAGIFQLILFNALLFRFFGVYYFSGILMFLLSFLINHLICKKLKLYSTEYLSIKDKRMRLTTQIFNHLRILKFNSWQEKFKSDLINIRETEVKSYEKLSYNNMHSWLLYWISPGMINLATIGSYYYMTNDLSPETIFTGMAILNALQEPMNYTPIGISCFIDMMVSFRRIEVI